MQPAAVSNCTEKNHRLCVTDYISGNVYLIDTGANVSVIPVSKVNPSKIVKNSKYKLYAANGTVIETYGVVN